MKTSEVLKKAMKLIELRPENWDKNEILFLDAPLDYVFEPFTIVGAIEKVVGTTYCFGVENSEEYKIIRDFDYLTADYAPKDALKIIDKLIRLALERGM